MSLKDPRGIGMTIGFVWLAMSHLCCDECLDEHFENPQSVSCYCRCHDSERDEVAWAEMKDHIKAIWPRGDERFTAKRRV